MVYVKPSELLSIRKVFRVEWKFQAAVGDIQRPVFLSGFGGQEPI